MKRLAALSLALAAACSHAQKVAPRSSPRQDARLAAKRGLELMARDPAMAAEAFGEAYALAPTAPLAYDLALARERAGDLAAAEASYEAALELDDKLDAARDNLARVKLERGDASGAAAIAEARAREAKSDAAAWARAALLRRAARQRSDARADARTALSLDPASGAALAAAALTELDAGNVAAARLILSRAARSADSLVLLAQAEIALADGHDGDALALLARARGTAPRQRAAAVLMDNGAYAEAAKELEGLSDPASLTLRGAALHAAGNDQDALAAYEAALAKDPERPDALFDLALLYRDGLKKPALALEAFKKYLAVEGRQLRRSEEAKAAIKDLGRP